MQRLTRTPLRGRREYALSVLLVLSMAIIASCNSPKRLQLDTSGAESYLETKIEDLDGDTVVVVLAPSAGWKVRHDGNRRDKDSFSIFITMTRPDPKYAHAQVETEHRVGTTIDFGEPVQPYIRILLHGEEPVEDDDLYRPARVRMNAE